MEIIVTLHAACLLLLCAYAVHQGALLFIYLLRGRSSQTYQPAAECPAVTIQIPLFNERYVAARVIAAAAAQDYPKDKLQIQILDDSTDDTTEIARRAAAQARSSGLSVDVLHRNERRGYKAGAKSASKMAISSPLAWVSPAASAPAL